MRAKRIIPVAIILLASTPVAVAAQDQETPAQAPVEFTGRLLYGPQTVAGTETDVGERTEVRGTAFQTPVLTMSDPRLDGIVTRTNNVDLYDDPPVWTWQALWRIETDEGAWQGVETPLVFTDGSRSTTTVVLVGEGAYDGLIALTEFDHESEGWDMRGAIIEGEMPPAPTSAAP
jgi:hypothetical protein